MAKQIREANALVNEPLKAGEILTAEFEYIVGTAFQANEDRARVTNFYLVTVASFVAAILGLQVEAFRVAQVYGGFAILFAVLGIAGFLTLLQLVRLRLAWFDSAEAMNQIKRFYAAHGNRSDLAEAFRWMDLPSKFKPWSISFLLALQVALLSSVAVGAAALFVGLAQGDWRWNAAIGSGLAALIVQMGVYWWLLRD